MDSLGDLVGNDNQGSSSSPSPSSSSPSDGNNGNNPSPSDNNGNNPSPSDNSSTPNSPPPDDSSPSGSNSAPPPPSGSDSSSDSPPPPSDSNSSPSPESNHSSPPPPSEDSGHSPPNSDSSPHPPSEDSGKSPPNSDSSQTPSQPPPSDNPPSDSQQQGEPAPKSPSDSHSPPEGTRSPPSHENQQAPPNDNQRDSPRSPASHRPPPSNDGPPSVLNPPGSHTPPSTRPAHSSSTQISSDSTTPSRSSNNSTNATIAGATVAGVLIIALVALCFVVTRKKKRRDKPYFDHYGPPPNNFSGSADGYYYGQTHSQPHSQQHSQQHMMPNSQQHSVGMPGYSQEYYGGKPVSSGMSSYGSYKGPDSGVIAGAQSCFSYEDLMGITGGFSRQNVIGEGGFGAVYKGFLPDGKAVAVKQLKAGSGQGEREFRAEVEIISRVHHRHLVSLVGYCIAENQRLLVYEFVPNNTLEYHLHGKGVPVMEWSKRLRIAIGSARGLAYLHEDCHPKIIHRDIKSANILIDDVFEAQVADFGLAKLSNDLNTHVSTRVMGTFGYMAPEYASSGKLTDRSDVFSFGVVLLELLTGRKPIDPNEDDSLVEWARPVLANAIETGDFSEVVDPRLEKKYVESEIFRMTETAAACVRHSAQKRPRMVQVLRALDTDGDMPDISNGVKVGQSTIFESGQYNDLQKFRMMAFGSGDSSEYKMDSGNMNSRDIPPPRPPPGWKPGESGSVDFPSGESETRAMNPRRSERYK